MKRLTTLIVLAVVVGVAGWIAFDDDISIRTIDLETAIDDQGTDPSERIVNLTEEGEELAQLVVELRANQLTINLAPSQGLATSQIELNLRRSHAAGPPPEVALHTPGGFPWPQIHFAQAADGGIRLGIDDLGIQGRGSTTLELELLEKPDDWNLVIDLVLVPESPPTFESYRATAELIISEEEGINTQLQAGSSLG